MEERFDIDVSVVVPVYNAGEFLIDCLESLVGQVLDSKKMEILLIDDGSTDGSELICDEYAARYPQLFSVIHCRHTGSPGAARNRGMKCARGEFIVFSDADDWWGREAINRLVDHARDWGSDMIQGRLCNVKNGHVEGMNKLFNSSRPSVPDADWRTFQQLTSTLGSIRCFKRSLAIDNDIWWEEDYWFEDLIFSLRLIFASAVCSVANDYNYYYVRRSDDNPSISTRQTEPLPIKRPENIVKSISKLFDLFDQQEESSETGKFLLQKYFRHPVVLGAEIVEEQIELSPGRYPEGPAPYFCEIWSRVKQYYEPCVRNGLSLEIRCAVDALAAGIEQSRLTQLRRVACSERKPREVEFLAENIRGVSRRVEGLSFLGDDTFEELILRQLSNVVFGMVHKLEVQGNHLSMEGDVFFPIYGAMDVEISACLIGKDRSYDLGSVDFTPEVFGEAFQCKGVWRIREAQLPSLSALGDNRTLLLSFRVSIGSLARIVVYSKDKAEGCWSNGAEFALDAGTCSLSFLKLKEREGLWGFRVESRSRLGILAKLISHRRVIERLPF